MLNFQLRKSLNLGGKIIPKGFSNPLKPRVVKVLGVFSVVFIGLSYPSDGVNDKNVSRLDVGRE